MSRFQGRRAEATGEADARSPAASALTRAGFYARFRASEEAEKNAQAEVAILETQQGLVERYNAAVVARVRREEEAKAIARLRQEADEAKATYEAKRDVAAQADMEFQQQCHGAETAEEAYKRALEAL